MDNGFTGNKDSVIKMNYLDSILQSFGAKTFGTPIRKLERAKRFIEHEEREVAKTLVSLSKKRTHDEMEYNEPIAYRTRSHKVQEQCPKKCKVEVEPINIPSTPNRKTKAPAPPVAARTRSKDAIAYRTRSHY